MGLCDGMGMTNATAERHSPERRESARMLRNLRALARECQARRDARGRVHSPRLETNHYEAARACADCGVNDGREIIDVFRGVETQLCVACAADAGCCAVACVGCYGNLIDIMPGQSCTSCGLTWAD